MENDYREINRRLWNAKTPVHLESPMYDLPGFLAGKTSLKPIEQELLGPVGGLSVLHLQCHFGQDTLSLARMGARTTGVDLSDEAIARARQLNEQLNLDARFIRCDIYDLPEVLDDTFDLVYTSYGTIGWLPDIERWAGVVARYIRPGGRFVFVEFHPYVWMYDEHFREVAYSYFNGEPIIEKTEGTYADRNAPIANLSVSWNHSLSSVLQALLDQRLTLRDIREYDYSPYDCFLDVKEEEPGKFRTIRHGNKIPMVYSVVAEKPV